MSTHEALNSPYHTIHKTLMMICGVWPYQKKYLKFFLRTFVSLAVFTVELPLFIRAVEEGFKENPDMILIIENFSGILYIQTMWAKYIMKIFAEDELLYLYKLMSKHYEELTSKEEQKILHRSWKISNYLAKFYLVYTILCLSFFVYSPLFIPKILDLLIPLNETRTRIFCTFSEYFIDIDSHYHLLMTHVYFGGFMSVLVHNGFDSTFVGICWHIIGLTDVVSFRMKELCRLTNNEISSIDGEQIHDHLKQSIKIHNRSIKFFYLVNSTYNQCFFFVSILLLTYLSTGTINILKNVDNPPVLIKIVAFWSAINMYMFFVNWPGQTLVDRCSTLRHDIFFCGWYNFPLRSRFLVQFMMMRLNKPSQLKAGPLLTMNLQTCGLILKTAMQYLAVVMSVNE